MARNSAVASKTNNTGQFETLQAIKLAKHLKLVDEVPFKQPGEDFDLILGMLQNGEEYRMLGIGDVCLARGRLWWYHIAKS